ncbi:hypothetical protein [Pontibacter actiniarum]|uniref:hypothetical protein n=1 Tax=Pontibacter actiniarum TaxID=323450 RepID=UPI0012F96B18|nr:hypothetical protein [Pontibacter actiniarum]
MTKLYKPSLLIVSVLLLALLMHFLREGAVQPMHLLSPVLLFAAGIAAGVLLKPTVAG